MIRNLYVWNIHICIHTHICYMYNIHTNLYVWNNSMYVQAVIPYQIAEVRTNFSSSHSKGTLKFCFKINPL